MTNHTGDWWLRETTPGTGTCTAAESDFTNKRSCGTGFRTGNATNGYALHSVTAKFRSKIGNPGSLGVNLYTSAGNDPANLISNATLSGSNPDTAGEYIYTCSGAGCSLSKDTTYFVVMTATAAAGRNIYLWQSANWDGETKIPSSNGWSIANGGKEGSAPPPIGNLTDASMMKIAATVNVPPSLTASGISGTGATLTIANDTGDWYYSASHPLATIPATTSPPAPRRPA